MSTTFSVLFVLRQGQAITPASSPAKSSMPIVTSTITLRGTMTPILEGLLSVIPSAMVLIGMLTQRITRSGLSTPRGWHKDRQMKRSTRQYETLPFSLLERQMRRESWILSPSNLQIIQTTCTVVVALTAVQREQFC